MKDADVPKTAFSAAKGKYALNCPSFELPNAPWYFARLMHNTFARFSLRSSGLHTWVIFYSAPILGSRTFIFLKILKRYPPLDQLLNREKSNSSGLK